MVCLNLQRNGTGNELHNIGDTFVEIFQLQISVMHQSFCIFKAGVSSLSDGWEKYKEKVLMCQIRIKISKLHTIPNSSLQNLKIYSSKGCRKTS